MSRLLLLLNFLRHLIMLAYAPGVLKELPVGSIGADKCWRVRKVFWTINADTMVLGLSRRRSEPLEAILKLTQTSQAAESLRHHIHMLELLAGDDRLGGGRKLLPRVLVQGERAGKVFAVETALPGMAAHQLAVDSEAFRRMQFAAAAAIRSLHRTTGRVIIADDELIDSWLSEPLQRLCSLRATRLGKIVSDGSLERLRDRIRLTMAGRDISVGWVHGDYWPQNILVTPDGANVTGILDWDAATPDGLQILDVMTLLLTCRMLMQRQEMGTVVRQLLRDGASWTCHEHRVLELASLPLVETPEGRRATVLLTWLRLVGHNLAKSERYARHRYWISRNVEAVLAAI